MNIDSDLDDGPPDDAPPDDGPPPDIPVRRVYLDTNVLLAYPEVLSRAPRNVRLIVPTPVLQELRSRATRPDPSRFSLKAIEEALVDGVLAEEAMQLAGSTLPRLSNVDMTLLRAAYVGRGSGAAIATNDRALLRAAQGFGVRAFDGVSLVQWLSTLPRVRLSRLRRYVRYAQVARLVFGLIVAAVALFLAYLVATVGPSILDALVRRLGLGLALLSLPVGYGLFVLRERRRVIYGFAEVVFGAGSVAIGVLKFQPDRVNSLSTIAAIGGGLYVIVRGLDNLDKAEDKSFQFLFRWIKHMD